MEHERLSELVLLPIQVETLAKLETALTINDFPKQVKTRVDSTEWFVRRFQGVAISEIPGSIPGRINVENELFCIVSDLGVMAPSLSQILHNTGLKLLILAHSPLTLHKGPQQKIVYGAPSRHATPLLMYWSVWGGEKGGLIERAHMDGGDRSHLVHTQLHWPAGLALHRDYLYWCDIYLNKIERLSLSSKMREVVVSNSPTTPVLKPYGLAIYEETRRSNQKGYQKITIIRSSVLQKAHKPLTSIKSALRLCDELWPFVHTFLLWYRFNETPPLSERCGYVGLPSVDPPNGAIRPYLTLSKDNTMSRYLGAIIWSEHDTGKVRRRDVNGTVTVAYDLPPPLYDLKLVSSIADVGENACSRNNGDCAALCLPVPGGRRCACVPPAHIHTDKRTCRTSTHAATAPPPAPPSPCDRGRFHCGTGQCIEQSYVCDGDTDCADGSDEDASPAGPCANATCDDNHLQCDKNRCIPKSWVCDGAKDCSDGWDEAGGCGVSTCGAEQWRCVHSGRCVPAAWRCDRAHDCGPHDTSDEEHCESVECDSRLMFGCSSGACVPWEYYCDGHADCADGSDERACRSTPASTPHPAPATTHHPHQRTHPNQHDTDKGGLCEEHEFQCKNTECIRKEFRCDQRVDCLDGSDEESCPSGAPPSPPPASPAPPAAEECAPPALACDNNTRCVPLHLQCDGDPDCDDGADEAGRCDEPMCLLSGCEGTCARSPGGPVCACAPPLQLAADGLTCEGAQLCRWGQCSQICEPHKNRHKCTCYENYQLADDGFTCKSTLNVSALIVFSNRHEVRGLQLPAMTSRALLSALKNTVAIDYLHSSPPTLYWTDVADDKIYSGALHPAGLSNIEVVVESGLTNAEGLAVDWVAHNLYWVDSSLHQIEVAKLDGRYRRTLISGDMDSPRAIAVDPNAGYLFWSDWEAAAARIERASLAGQNRTVVVHVGALIGGAWPNGITLDHRARTLYWIDARSDAIHCSTYEGTRVVSVLQSHSALAHPFAITVYEGSVYWTDWRSNSVVRADKFTGQDVAVLTRTLTQPFDIKVIHPSRQPPAKYNPCESNGNCSHLCLIDSPQTRVCACPHLMRLANDTTCEPHEVVLLIGRRESLRGVEWEAPARTLAPARTAPLLRAPTHLHAHTPTQNLYLVDADTSELLLLDVRGGAARVVAEGVGAACVGAGALYYHAGGALWAADLNGHRPVRLLRINTPHAIAVDPLRGKLYWAVRGEGGERLERADGDGSNRVVLKHARDDPYLADVTSMTMDVEANRLYWVNSGSATIQYLDLNRTDANITTLPLGWGSRPSAMTVYNGEVVWADAATVSVRACKPPHCRQPRELLRGRDAEGVLSLLVYDPRVQARITSACARRARACEHLCLSLSNTRSTCRCALGYTLQGDHCVPVDEIVVYSLSWEVRGVAADPDALKTNATDEVDETVEDIETDETSESALPPIPQLTMASAIDYHAESAVYVCYAEGGWLYWSDGEAGRVWRVRRDGTSRQMLLQQNEPIDQPYDLVAGIAVDWVGGNVLWSDPRRGVVEAARLDGTRRYVLLDTAPAAVSSLCVDAVRGWVFMSGGGWIQRARLHGAQRSLLYNGTAVADIALDTQNEEVYWADSWEGSVWRMSYNGTQQRRVSAARHNTAALAVHQQKLYWLDTVLHQGSVLVAPLTNLSDYRVLAENVGDSLKDILVWSRSDQTLPNKTVNKSISSKEIMSNVEVSGGYCAGGADKCEGLCLWDRCVCPHGRLAPNNVSCTPYDTFVMYSRVTKIDSIHVNDERDFNSPYPPIQDK
ncbi:unnamed protein product [Diatraea saccharalis]|uniref:EGF-like domain-containing protein n=1 Tax=Diatraea saccharalis TaxID=40085 RepID=A0A9N9WJC8_9NEOP|nr:unnamed protein product [Diatraea saccharalis]